MRQLDFFPISFWNYCDLDMNGEEAVKDWKDCGITLPMTQVYDPEKHSKERFIKVLDTIAAQNMKAIIWDERLLRNNGDFTENYDAFIKNFGSHPATYGFFVGDEPDRTMFDDICKKIRLAREINSDFLPFLNLLPKHPGFEHKVGFASWARYLDKYLKESNSPLLCYDCYSQLDEDEPEKGLEQYFDNLREFREASERNNVPFWTTLLSVGHFAFRCPTEDDFRWQLNTAVAHGAKGILWFFLYMRYPHSNYRVSPIDEHGERSETFERLSRVQRTFLKMHANVFLKLKLKNVYHFGKAYGGHILLNNNCNRIHSITSKQPLVITEWEDELKRPYISFVNNSPFKNTRVTTKIKGNSPIIWRQDWLYKENEVKGNKGEDFISLWFDLAPGQMEIYRIEEVIKQ